MKRSASPQAASTRMGASTLVAMQPQVAPAPQVTMRPMRKPSRDLERKRKRKMRPRRLEPKW